MLTDLAPTGQDNSPQAVCPSSFVWPSPAVLTYCLDIASDQTQEESSQERRLKSLVRAFIWVWHICILTELLTVLLQAMKTEPPLDAKCRDKFLVQSVAVTADKEFTNIASIVSDHIYFLFPRVADVIQWQHIDDSEKSSIQEKKIRVVYLPAEGSAAAATPLKNGVNGSVSSTHPRSYCSN